MLIHAVEPFRLDLTAAVLRRLSTNVVDVVLPDGAYVRALDSAGGPFALVVRQTAPAALDVQLTGGGAGEEDRAVAIARRVLGTDRSLAVFDRGARSIPWLRDLAQRMRGVKPPRYPSLWEAAVNAIVFQQVSIYAAAAILRRVIEAVGAPLDIGGARMYAFPEVDAFVRADDAVLRVAGLSAAKVATLRRVGDALRTGALDEAMLESETTADAAGVLTGIKGIGPWTAAVILLRGMGRLDVFPQNDSGVARGLAQLAGRPVDPATTFAQLGEERGMLYYHLLLARLEARGEVTA